MRESKWKRTKEVKVAKKNWWEKIDENYEHQRANGRKKTKTELTRTNVKTNIRMKAEGRKSKDIYDIRTNETMNNYIQQSGTEKTNKKDRTTRNEYWRLNEKEASQITNENAGVKKKNEKELMKNIESNRQES